MNKQQTPFLFCLLMDGIGYVTYAFPVLGELGDVFWAPVSAIIFYRTFGGWRGSFGSLFNFAEELLPGTDFVPSFTLMWIWNYVSRKRTGAAIVKTQ
ncbi:MAG: hypothetical protein ACOVP7_10775 [Lacibacter sp.]